MPETRKSPSQESINKAIGDRVRAHRQAAKVTQAALGEGVGVTYQQVQKYENGTNRISASMIVNIAGLLHCSVSDLMDPVSFEAGAPASQNADRILRDPTVLYSELSLGSRALVAELVRTLHEQEHAGPRDPKVAPASQP